MVTTVGRHRKLQASVLLKAVWWGMHLASLLTHLLILSLHICCGYVLSSRVLFLGTKCCMCLACTLSVVEKAESREHCETKRSRSREQQALLCLWIHARKRVPAHQGKVSSFLCFYFFMLSPLITDICSCLRPNSIMLFSSWAGRRPAANRLQPGSSYLDMSRSWSQTGSHLVCDQLMRPSRKRPALELDIVSSRALASWIA